jgi:DNA polymerase II large subunit
VSETRSSEDIVEGIQQTEDRLSEAVEALAYKKGHLKDDVKGAVVEKKDAIVGRVKDKVAERKDDVVGAVEAKIAEQGSS